MNGKDKEIMLLKVTSLHQVVNLLTETDVFYHFVSGIRYKLDTMRVYTMSMAELYDMIRNEQLFIDLDKI
jgi:hypothetical protein